MWLLGNASALSAEEPSLWQEIWDYLYSNYFSPEAVYFEHLDLGSNAMATIRNIVLGLLIGVIVASLFIVIDKRVLGAFVRKLLSEDCTSPEKAKRLSELDFVTNFTIRNGVRRGSTLRSVVRCREEEEFLAGLAEQRAKYEAMRQSDPSLPPFKEATYSVNADEDHFYIPEEKKYSAELRFEKKGTTWLGFAMVIVISIIAFVILIFALPEMLRIVDSFVGSFGSSNGNILT
ncbi:MAG: hypothetical protein J6A83_08255 [Clostridia bacterium]|nr:hypothetical protein [Clostridia bacterium]